MSSLSEAERHRKAPSILTHARPRYLFSLAVHVALILLNLALLIIYLKDADSKLVLSVKNLSKYVSITTFVTTTFIRGYLALMVWSIQSLALSKVFITHQSLTALRQNISAWSGLGAAIWTIASNMKRNLRSPIVITLFYFGAITAVGSLFPSMFTFSTVNISGSSLVPLNAITSNLIAIADPSNMTESETSAGALWNSNAFRDGAEQTPRLNSFSILPGLGVGLIFDTLSQSSGPADAVTAQVDASSVQVQCGEVPADDYNVRLSDTGTAVNFSATAQIDSHTYNTSLSIPYNWFFNSLLTYPVYNFLDEGANAKFTPTRNVYLAALSRNTTFFPTDSNGSVGQLAAQNISITVPNGTVSAPPGLQTISAYVKLITCAVTVTKESISIDGDNNPAPKYLDENRNDPQFPLPKAHPWTEMQPLPSRQQPYEDIFSAIFSGQVNIDEAAIKFGQRLDFTPFEEGLNIAVTKIEQLELALVNYASISYITLGQAATSVDDPKDKWAAWQYEPSDVVADTGVLHARLNLSRNFVFLSVAASICLLILFFIGLGGLPGKDEKIISGRSTRPERISQQLDDKDVLDLMDLFL